MDGKHGVGSGEFSAVCKDMVGCLVEHILSKQVAVASGGASSTESEVACFLTLHLFCEANPKLLIDNVERIRPNLHASIANGTPIEQKNAFHILYYTAKILAKVSNPGTSRRMYPCYCKRQSDNPWLRSFFQRIFWGLIGYPAHQKARGDVPQGARGAFGSTYHHCTSHGSRCSLRRVPGELYRTDQEL